MNCEDIRGQLNEYCDGELLGADLVALEEHLEQCAECRAEIDDLRALIADAAELQQDVRPERDLWPAIESRLLPRTGRIARGPWRAVNRVALAAAAALFAAVVLWMVVEPQPESVDNRPAVATIGRSPEAISVSLSRASERARAESGFMHVREDLLRTIASHRDDLDPETRQLVDENLQIIDQAMGEIFSALEQDPGNAELEHRLAATYQREVEFLRQLNSALGV